MGGGFGGLTMAAGLLEKEAHADITVFEERDTLIPLQHGTDSRWLHPQIYGWPGPRSEVNVAMLPILNWTAARASDVVVQTLTEWRAIARNHQKSVKLYCNARHLQIQHGGRHNEPMRIEWVGEERNPEDATILDDLRKQTAGLSEPFDIVILAIGFGLEKDGALSYWRNETLAQPSLRQPRNTYLVSGQGDGAMIDLLRLRISQFRQDRILDELFTGRDALLTAVRALSERYGGKSDRTGLYSALEQLSRSESGAGSEFQMACDTLRRRLRRDTEVIFRMQQPQFSLLFGPRTSFQNRLLVYMLYRCGGFIPTHSVEKDIVAQYAVPDRFIIRRHGTHREELYERVLSTNLFTSLQRATNRSKPLSLTDEVNWPGGYFGFPGQTQKAGLLSNELKKNWRKEYLPAPTALIASSFCSTIAGYLSIIHPKEHRLRVTLHRAISFGEEEVLQQSCEYQGIRVEPERTSGRTFPAENATIGVAYRCREIIRSRRKITRTKLRQTMNSLKLGDASSEMSKKVGFVLAIPLLEPEHNYTHPRPIVGIIYIDSNAPNFFIDDDHLTVLISMTQSFLDDLASAPPETLGRVRNFPLNTIQTKPVPTRKLPSLAAATLTIVSGLRPPRSPGPFELNYDYSDFVPTQIRSTI